MPSQPFTAPIPRDTDPVTAYQAGWHQGEIIRLEGENKTLTEKLMEARAVLQAVHTMLSRPPAIAPRARRLIAQAMESTRFDR